MSAPITVTGWVGNKPAITIMPGGRRRTTVRVASTHRYRNDRNEWIDGETTWYSVSFWDDAAETVAASVHIGEPVVVTGRLVLDRWDGPDGPRAELALRGATIGHDLTRGKASFARVLRPGGPTGPEPGGDGFASAEVSETDPFAHPGPADGPDLVVDDALAPELEEAPAEDADLVGAAAPA